MMQSSIMDALFCNDQEQAVMSQQQLQSSDQDHHRPPPPPPLANNFLDYTPDLTTETPDDDPMASFDDFYMSPQVSSYLQYLKEDPSPMERWPVLQDWLGLDTNNYASNEFLFGLPTATTTTTTTTAAPAVSASDPPTSDWLYDPSHCYFSTDHRPSIDSSACTDDLQELIGMGGMTRDFVSLSDVNSFVAEADSQKHAASIHLSYAAPDHMQVAAAAAAAAAAATTACTSNDNALGITSFVSMPVGLNQMALASDSDSETSSSQGVTQGNGHIKPIMKKSASSTTISTSLRRRRNLRKSSSSDILQHRRHNHKVLKRSSDSISTLLARQRLSDVEDEEEDEDDDYIFRGDADDDDFALRTSSSTSTASSASARKGRNVDKACNHCKRSHLRCDNMRPCRRCIATGKTGCKDVEHKPRGRPRLNKNIKKDTSLL